MTDRRTSIGASAFVVDRRSWLITLAGMVTALRVGAQGPRRVFRIGLLTGLSPQSSEARHLWQGFFDGLRELGYVEGQNVLIEGRYYGDRLDQLPSFAAELVRLQVDVIVAGAPPAPEAARSATSTIPIVMANHSDPVASGLVTNFARPGGNITGLSIQAVEIRLKHVQLLKEVLPGLTRMAFLRNPDIPLDLRDTDVAARSLGVETRVVEARAPHEIADAFSAAAREKVGAVSVLGGALFFAHRGLIAELAFKTRLPTVYQLREHAEAGGLLTYGVDLRDNYRRAAGYVDKILKGANPGELPIEQPTKFELVVNLKTARKLGVTIPQSVLLRASEVIQ